MQRRLTCGSIFRCAQSVALALWLSGAAAGASTAGQFLDRLAGKWLGRAVHTPAGELPYDINFARTTPDCVQGVAAPGGANHHWKFCDAGGELILEFLSDFRGNRRPALLHRVSMENELATFASSTHEFMHIQIHFQDRAAWFRVYHHGRLHVAIWLIRDE